MGQCCMHLQGGGHGLTEQAKGGTDGPDGGEGSCLHAWARGAAITSYEAEVHVMCCEGVGARGGAGPPSHDRPITPRLGLCFLAATCYAYAPVCPPLQDTLLASERLTHPFMAALEECGWCTDKVVVEAVRRRARWSV